MRDQLACTSAQTAERTAFKILGRLQTESPAAQVAGASMLFAMLVKRFKVDPRDALAQADRRIADCLKDPQFRAIREYLKEELR